MSVGITGRMSIAGLLVLVAVGITFGFLFDAVADLRAAGTRAQASQELIVAASEVEGLVVEAQASTRGYLIANDPAFLTPYEAASERLEGAIARFLRLARGEPVRERRAQRAAAAVRSYYDDWTRPTLATARRDIAAARALVSSGEGERRVAAIRSLVSTLVAEERRHADSSVETADRSGRRAVVLGVVAIVTIVGLIAAIVAYFARGVVTPVKQLAVAARSAAEGGALTTVASGGVGETSVLVDDFNEMVRVRGEQARELQRQRAELSAVLEAANEGIAMAATDGTLVFSNARMDGLWQELGVAEKGSIWNRVAGLVQLTGTPERYAAAFAAIADDPDAVFSDDFDVPPLSRSFHGFTAPVRGPYGFVIGRLFVLRETTREQAAARAKEQFLATVSHELRTPLTSIVGFTELVRQGEVGEVTREQDRFLAIVDRSARQLHALVDDLLTVGRTDEGRLDLALEDLDLALVVADAVEAAAMAADEKRIELALESVAAPLRGDRRRLTQLAGNLVANAIKFTPEHGRVDVRVQREPGGVVLEVADTGIGINAEDQERLFERFFRAASATEAQVPGTGLGLAICKEIVEAHGGTITVSSATGAGTTFRVQLPEGD